MLVAPSSRSLLMSFAMLVAWREPVAAALLVAPELLERVVHEAAVDRAAYLDALRREAVGHVPVHVVLHQRGVELAVRVDRQAHGSVQPAVAHSEVARDDVDDLFAVDVAV